ncbi:MAG: thiamine pyrophosphate-dependent enzyme [Candidatus Thorarchaeota archaeon]
MYGYEIIQEIAQFLTGDDVIVSTNGNISRQVYHYLPRPQIYLRGSMGLGIPVGLGVALSCPEKRVLVIAGDGNLLMGLGSLATTSFVRPRNLRILVLDNNEYATTGHQQTTSETLNYPSLLEGFGIANLEPIQRNDSVGDVRTKIQALLAASELCILPALVKSNPPTLSNIPWHPEKIAAFQRATEH